jgi:arginase
MKISMDVFGDRMNKKLNLFVPQWQDSGASKELYDGACALKKYIENSNVNFERIEISQNSELIIENNILGYRIIKTQLNNISQLLYEEKPDKILTVGGGCGIEIPIVSYFSEKYKNLDVLWFDAHGDLNTPESSPSKYFHGMPLRFLLEEIRNNDISSKFNKINPQDVVLIGVRDLDKPEEDFIFKENIKIKNDLNISELLNKQNEYVYIHIDLDVLDPAIYRNVKCPSKNGLKVEEVVKIIKDVNNEKKVIGISLLENTETNIKKIEIIDEIIKLGIEF